MKYEPGPAPGSLAWERERQQFLEFAAAHWREMTRMQPGSNVRFVPKSAFLDSESGHLRAILPGEIPAPMQKGKGQLWH